MDKELKDILTRLIEGQNRLKGDFDSLDDKINNLSEGQNNLKGEVQKNSIKLESVEKKIDTIAEVQKNHMGQNEKAHKEIIKPLNEKVDVIGLAVKNTSKDMKELKDKFDKVEKVTIQNTYDVAYLKSAK